MIYAGASGVGTSLIQLVKYFKANSVALSSNEKKRDYCLRYLRFLINIINY